MTDCRLLSLINFDRVARSAACSTRAAFKWLQAHNIIMLGRNTPAVLFLRPLVYCLPSATVRRLKWHISVVNDPAHDFAWPRMHPSSSKVLFND